MYPIFVIICKVRTNGGHLVCPQNQWWKDSNFQSPTLLTKLGPKPPPNIVVNLLSCLRAPPSRPQTIGIPNDFPTTFEDRLGGDFKCNETQLLLPSSSRDQRKRTFVSQEKPGKERTSKVSQRRECSNLTIYIHYKVLFEIRCGFSEQRIASRTYVGTVDW